LIGIIVLLKKWSGLCEKYAPFPSKQFYDYFAASCIFLHSFLDFVIFMPEALHLFLPLQAFLAVLQSLMPLQLLAPMHAILPACAPAKAEVIGAVENAIAAVAAKVKPINFALLMKQTPFVVLIKLHNYSVTYPL
jgi:hypothetical protein